MSYFNGPKIVTNGLVLCLDASNTKSYPGTGTAFTDLTLNKYNHTLVSASFTTVDGVNCFNCSTTGRCYPSGSSYTFGTSYTMLTWARVISSTTTWRTLWRTTPDDHPVLVETGTNRLGYYDNNGGNFVPYNLDVSTLGLANKWTMYTVTNTGTGSTNLYINGLAAKGTVAYTANGTTHNAWGNEAGGSQPFGYISTALLYNRGITESEILQNFNATKGRFGL